MKQCSRCREVKPVTEFHRRQNQCKGCREIYRKAYMAHPENKAKAAVRKRRSKERRRLILYGVTKVELPDACEVCGTTRNLRIDHAHDTGQYRGVLCHRHNVALGMVRDNVDELLLLVNYLRS